jgi:hypothetical protein
MMGDEENPRYHILIRVEWGLADDFLEMNPGEARF